MAFDVATLSMKVDASGLVKGEQALTKLATAGARVELQVNKSASGMSRGFNAAADQAGKSTGKLGQQFQQSGYQVQDFAVQIASGQSALTAFAQQAPQLLAGLGVAGATGILLSLSATAIAVGAALYNSLGSKAKSFTDIVDDLNRVLSDAASAAKAANTPYSDLVNTYGDLADASQRALRGQAELAGLAASKGVKDLFSSGQGYDLYNDLIQGTNTDNLRRGFSYATDAAMRLRSEWKLTGDQGVNLLSVMYKFSGAGSLDEQARAAADLQSVLIGVYGSLGAMPLKVQEIYSALSDVVSKGGEFKVGMENVVSLAGQFAGIDLSRGVLDASAAAADMARQLGISLETAQKLVDLRYGVDKGTPLFEQQMIDPSLTMNDLLAGISGTYLAPLSTIRPQAAPHGVAGEDWGAPPKAKKAPSNRLDGYESALTSIANQTQAMKMQTGAIASFTGAGRDLQYQLALISKEQDLLTAAQRAGKEITPQLRSQVKSLAAEYVEATRAMDDAKRAQDDVASGKGELVSLFSSVRGGVRGQAFARQDRDRAGCQGATRHSSGAGYGRAGGTGQTGDRCQPLLGGTNFVRGSEFG